MQLLFELCRFRNRHPAFDGTFELLDTLTHVQDAVTISNRTMPTAEPKEQGEQKKRDEEESSSSSSEDGFLEMECACKVKVADSKEDWCARALHIRMRCAVAHVM